jgi:hypothetical protein
MSCLDIGIFDNSDHYDHLHRGDDPGDEMSSQGDDTIPDYSGSREMGMDFFSSTVMG